MQIMRLQCGTKKCADGGLIAIQSMCPILPILSGHELIAHIPTALHTATSDLWYACFLSRVAKRPNLPAKRSREAEQENDENDPGVANQVPSEAH